MEIQMLTAIENRKVGRSVVSSVFVSMVNDLVAVQKPANYLLDDRHVFMPVRAIEPTWMIFIASTQVPIAIKDSAAFPCVVLLGFARGFVGAIVMLVANLTRLCAELPEAAGHLICGCFERSAAVLADSVYGLRHARIIHPPPTQHR